MAEPIAPPAEDAPEPVPPPAPPLPAGTRRRVGGGTAARWAAVVIALAFAIAFPWIRDALPNSDYWLPMTTVLITADFVLLALGLNIVVGYAGLLDLGYVAFWAIGAYVAGWLASGFFVERSVHILTPIADTIPGIHVNFWLVVIAGGVACALAGIVIGAPTLRLRGDYLAIVTLGFGEIIPQAFLNLEEYTGGARGITPLDPIGLGVLSSATGGAIPETVFIFDLKPRYFIIMFFCLVAIYVSLRLRDAKLGRAWIAIREDELAAGAMGIPLMRTKLWAYAVGAFFGGVGGVFYAIDQSAVFPTSFFFNISILILCMVILGGMGNVWGVILGAALIAWLNYKGLAVIGTAFNSAAGTDINVPNKSFLIFGVILVVMMLLRPEGILPAARQKALIHEEVDEGSATGAKA